MSLHVLCTTCHLHRDVFFFFYLYGDLPDLHVLTHSFPTRPSSDLEADLARLRVVEALGELEEGRLAGARRADDRDRLARPDGEREIVERRGVGARRIAEFDAREFR